MWRRNFPPVFRARRSQCLPLKFLSPIQFHRRNGRSRPSSVASYICKYLCAKKRTFYWRESKVKPQVGRTRIFRPKTLTTHALVISNCFRRLIVPILVNLPVLLLPCSGILSESRRKLSQGRPKQDKERQRKNMKNVHDVRHFELIQCPLVWETSISKFWSPEQFNSNSNYK